MTDTPEIFGDDSETADVVSYLRERFIQAEQGIEIPAELAFWANAVANRRSDVDLGPPIVIQENAEAGSGERLQNLASLLIPPDVQGEAPMPTESESSSLPIESDDQQEPMAP